ncbi:MAG: hypothetical protein ACR2PK_12585 [Acidimicrobiales bacterium]
MVRRLAIGLPIGMVLILLLAACGNSGEPTGFDQQPVPVSSELGAALGTEVEFLPVVERNFLEGCVLAENPRIDGVTNLPASCECAYASIVDFYRQNSSGETPDQAEQNAYDQFKDLDESLQSETGLVPSNIQSLLDECAV